MPKRAPKATEAPSEKKARLEMPISNATSEQIIATKAFFEALRNDDDESVTDTFLETVLAIENSDSVTSEMIDQMLDYMMPTQGPADTFHGEVLRAASTLRYRYMNDGEFFWSYDSSANCAFTFLEAKKSMTHPSIESIIKDLDEILDIFPVAEETYKKGVDLLMKNVVYWCIHCIKNGTIPLGNSYDYLRWGCDYSDREKEAITDFMLDKLSEVKELSEIVGTYEITIKIDM